MLKTVQSAWFELCDDSFKKTPWHRVHGFNAANQFRDVFVLPHNCLHREFDIWLIEKHLNLHKFLCNFLRINTMFWCICQLDSTQLDPILALCSKHWGLVTALFCKYHDNMIQMSLVFYIIIRKDLIFICEISSPTKHALV